MRDPGDKQHFGDMLQGLSVAVKGGEVTAGVLKVYWLCLRDLPMADFDMAIGKAAERHDWFPSVNEIRELAGHKRRGAVPLYLRPVEDELERIETCSFHVAQGGTKVAPDFVPWCRKCRRHKALAERGGPPTTLGDVMAIFGVVKGGGAK